MKRYCIACGKDISGKRSGAIFCGDACRKYYRRNGARMPHPIQPVKPIDKADKSGLVRTKRFSSPPKPGGSSFGYTFGTVYKKSGSLGEATLAGALDVAADILAHKFKDQLDKKEIGHPADPHALQGKEPKAPPRTNQPLRIRTADRIAHEKPSPSLDFLALFRDFLGEVAPPFKMLLWGPAGSGKSTFSKRLLDELNVHFPTVYISAEEALDSTTLKSRIRRTMKRANKTAIIDRLPEGFDEWRSVLLTEDALRQAVVFDTLTKLGITPFYWDAEYERIRACLEREGSTDELFFLYMVYVMTSLIWITHAYKDGKDYIGHSSWAHEADIVVRCEEGRAITIKNRFGEAGKVFEIFT